MKKKLLILLLLVINALIYANDPVFILNKDVTLKDGDWNVFNFHKGDKFIFNYDNQGFGILNYNTLQININLNTFNDTYNKYYVVSLDDVYLSDYSLKLDKNISKDFWIPLYYYDLLKSNNPKNDLLKYEAYWQNKSISYEDSDITWENEFGLLKYFLGNYYFIVFGRYKGYNEVDFFAYLEETSYKKATYIVQKMYSHSFDYQDEYMAYLNQPEFLPLYEKETPFKVIFTIDGDYMNMYIDEISEKNLFQTLVRTTPEACDQIENFIKGESNDLSKVVMPKNENNFEPTTTSPSQESSTNVAPNKTMFVTQELRLRKGEETSTDIITTMAPGTRVKIIQLGKAETLYGINSNWVQVKVLADAKDRDENKIKTGTKGWCYGGYLTENDSEIIKINIVSEKPIKKESSTNFTPLILGSAVAILVIILITILFLKKKKSKQ